MKNRNFAQKFLGYIAKELEVTLAVLVLLGFLVGSSMAQSVTPTEEVAPDSPLSVAETSTDSVAGFAVRNTVYSCLNFSSATVTNCYKVRSTSTTPDDAYASPEGLFGATPAATYTTNFTLAQPTTTTVYLEADNFTATTVNGTVVTSSTQGVKLVDASKITITFKGGDGGIKKLTLTPGAASAPKSVTAGPTISKFYLFPTDANIRVGGRLTLKSLAFNADGQSVNVKPAWKITSGSSNAEIDTTTGEIVAKAAGPVVVEASVDGFSARATITILPAAEIKTTTSTPTTSTTPSTATTTPTASKYFQDADKAQLPTTSEATTTTVQESAAVAAKINSDVTALFSAEATAKRAETTGRTQPTQSEIRTVVAAQPTLTAKVSARVSIAVREIGSTIREMTQGVKITNDKGEVVIEKPSALKAIGNFVLNLISGGKKDAGASPLRGDLGGDSND